jgi:hypothetical protein
VLAWRSGITLPLPSVGAVGSRKVLKEILRKWKQFTGINLD